MSRASVRGETHVRRLPAPRRDGGPTLERALAERRSVRDYSGLPLRLTELSRLLWAAQGITGAEGLRTAPSAGALYPLEVCAVAGAVHGLSSGIYRYRPADHALALVVEGDRRGVLSEAALGQRWMAGAAVVLALTAIYSRTTRKYGERGRQYVHMEVGHAAQNVCLEAVALGLGAAVVGAFEERAVAAILRLARGEEPLCLIPVGRR